MELNSTVMLIAGTVVAVAEGLILIKWMLGRQGEMEKQFQQALVSRDNKMAHLEQAHNDERVHIAENYVKKKEIENLEKKIENLETKIWEKLDQIQMMMSQHHSNN